jgi:hypothetical protein
VNEDGDVVNRESLFLRAAGAIGDLGNAFYREARQRDVWNEASALLWSGPRARRREQHVG